MKIAVMGAGAVGCYFGALLAKAGHELVLIGRPAHVEAIAAKGLLLERASGSEYVPLRAVTGAEGVQGAGLVLVCVKSADTEQVAAEMAPHLAPAAMLISLQNGVGNAQRLTTALGRGVLPAAVYVATEMAGPGHVRHHGRGELKLGQGHGARELAALLNEAAIPTDIAEDVEAVLWTKLVLNCAYNAVSAVTRAPYGHIVAVEGAHELIRALVDEAVAVAAAEGVLLAPDQAERCIEAAQAMKGQLSSTAQDLIRGRKTEIDDLNGHVVRRGAAHGIPTPVNAAMTTLVKILETAPA